MAARQDRFTHMTTTPVPSLIVELAIPTIITMMVTGVYNAADTYFVGRITEGATGAVAAVGVSFSIMMFIQALGFFCGHGSGNYLARRLGAGDQKEAAEMAATGFALAILIGIIFSACFLYFLRPISLLLGAMEEFLPETQRYMRIILCGAPFMMAQIVINNQLRFQGAAVYAMIGLVSGSLINIVLDPILIFGFDMGISGAALATVISQITAFTILLFCSRRADMVRIKASNIRFNRHYLLGILNGGAPSLLRQGLQSVATIALNTMAGTYGGAAAIAGMSVCTRVTMLAGSALIGFGQGLQPVASFNYGAKLYHRVKEAFWFCVKYGTIFLTVVGALLCIFAPQVIRFFRDDDAVVAVGTVALRYQAFFYPLWPFLTMSNMTAQSIGKGVRASILASAKGGIFFFPLIFTLPHFLGLYGVEITQAVADVCSFLLAVPIAWSVLREMKD